MDDVSPNRSPNPTSEKKIKANRRNASKSTGPRSARGKSERAKRREECGEEESAGEAASAHR